MYQDHSEAELRRWATLLRHFRFCRAIGGHANDGDSLEVALSCGSEAELLEICTQIGLTLTPLPADEPRPEAGRTYTHEEYARFRTPMRAFPQWQQPGHCALRSGPAFVGVESGRVTIDVLGASGDGFAVNEVDFENALRIERDVMPLASRVIDPPKDNDYCVCPKYHPDFWAARADPNALRPPTSQEP